RRSQFLPALRRRHQVVFVLRAKARHQFALFRMAGHDGVSARFKRLEGLVLAVEAQLRFSLLLVGLVAGETLVGKNRVDFNVEIDRPFAGGAGTNPGRQPEQQSGNGHQADSSHPITSAANGVSRQIQKSKNHFAAIATLNHTLIPFFQLIVAQRIKTDWGRVIFKLPPSPNLVAWTVGYKSVE